MKTSSLVLCLLMCGTFAHAQTDEAKPVKTAATKAAAPVDAEAIKERRARARALLVSLSSDARTFNDQTLRARSLARIADALWQVDTEQGRLLFRKAWEAAEVSDQESDRKLEEEIARQKARTGGGYALNLPPNVRREVLKLAARRDRALGEEFLEKLKAQKADAKVSVSTGRIDEAMSQRIAVAKDLLHNGDSERALQFAGPAIATVNRESIDFLVDLRAKNATAADAAYAQVLVSSANNPQADANTVSLLSSYIFTPRLYVTFSGNGASTSQSSSTITPAEVTPQLLNAFYHSASAILMRPLPAPGQPDQSTSGLDGKYLVIKRLMPFFEQSAAPELVESLRGHLNALNAVVSDSARRRDDEWLSRGVKPDKPVADREQSLLERIDRAKTSAERDSLYIQLAMMAAGKGEMKARDYISKVENSEERKQAGAYVDSSLAMQFVGKKQADEALEMVHKGDLTHLQKAWVMTEAAKVLAKTDKTRALELADEASTEARRLDVSDPGLPRALVAVANALKLIEPGRVWDATFDAVKAANSAEGFTGEDGEMVMKFQSRGQSSVHTNDVPDFDLEGIFRDLADQDYDRAVELARGFQGEGPRAVATIAIARAILEPKKSTTAKK